MKTSVIQSHHFQAIFILSAAPVPALSQHRIILGGNKRTKTMRARDFLEHYPLAYLPTVLCIVSTKTYRDNAKSGISEIPVLSCLIPYRN